MQIGASAQLSASCPSLPPATAVEQAQAQASAPAQLFRRRRRRACVEKNEAGGSGRAISRVGGQQTTVGVLQHAVSLRTRFILLMHRDASVQQSFHCLDVATSRRRVRQTDEGCGGGGVAARRIVVALPAARWNRPLSSVCGPSFSHRHRQTGARQQRRGGRMKKKSRTNKQMTGNRDGSVSVVCLFLLFLGHCHCH